MAPVLAGTCYHFAGIALILITEPVLILHVCGGLEPVYFGVVAGPRLSLGIANTTSQGQMQALSGSCVRAMCTRSIADDEWLVHGSFRIARSLRSRIQTKVNA